MSRDVQPVKGAASYHGLLKKVLMVTPEGYISEIDKASSEERAHIKANKWQIKENIAILKLKKLL